MIAAPRVRTDVTTDQELNKEDRYVSWIRENLCSKTVVPIGEGYDRGGYRSRLG